MADVNVVTPAQDTAPVLRPKEAASPAPNHTRRAAGRESDDTYPHIIVRIDDATRVINCRDDIQWILQVWRKPQWRNISFCRNRDVLIQRSGATGDALETLRALPEMHP